MADIMRFDARGCAVTGATATALDMFEEAFAAFRSWRDGADALVEQALAEAPLFVMAHVLKAWLLMGRRDPGRVHAVRPVWAAATRLSANEREGGHLQAIAAMLGDDFARAQACLEAVLRHHPLDLLALQVLHALDHASGQTRLLLERAATVMPAWSRNLPGYHAVLSMHAFGLEEAGAYKRARYAAHEALRLERFDARAHHVLAHVFEMTGHAEAGLRWTNEHRADWAEGTVVANHMEWHLALFDLARGDEQSALLRYDRKIRPVPEASSHVADLIDASSLLWRLHLRGADLGSRWAGLAAAWGPHIEDRFCSFHDVHAMLAFVGARDWTHAHDLERVLSRSRLLSTRHGETTRLVGLPACRALIAFGLGDDALAISHLASLPAVVHRLGGSHAQRSVFHQTLVHASERSRTPKSPRDAITGDRGVEMALAR